MRALPVLYAALFLVGCSPHPKTAVLPVPYRHWESNSVMCNDVRLHYWRTGGERKPVIIMAHGITDFGLNWATLAGQLEDDYDIIMYDARGHGFSQKPEGPYSLEAHMQDLVGLIHALGIERPILMGHSMGGSTVALTAAAHPDLPKAVIMEDPPMEEALEHLTEAVHQDWKNRVAEMTLTPKQELMKGAETQFHPGWTPFEYDLWAESKHLVDPNVIDIMITGGFGNPREMFPRIKAPTLILKAGAQDESYRKRHLEAAELLPNGRLIHIEGAGHLIRHDRLLRTEQEIRKFLDNL